VLNSRHDFLLGRAIRFQLIRDHERGTRHWRFSSLRSSRLVAFLYRPWR
jgi:hypothetical protein